MAALAGTTDVDAITLSMAQYARSGNPQVAAHAITIAVLSNTVVKTGMVLVLGSGAAAQVDPAAHNRHTRGGCRDHPLT